VPAWLQVAIPVLAALLPFMLKLTAAGPLVRLQVYARFASPPSSAPRTLRLVLVPVTGEGEALAGVATVGTALLIVMAALPLIEQIGRASCRESAGMVV